MEMFTGSDRRVFVGDRWTIKIARSNPGNFIESIKYIYGHRGVKGIINTWKHETPDGYVGMKWNLFHGVTANRRERRLARISDLIIPTRTLLAGVINIQPTTDSASLDYDDILGALAENLDQPGMNIPRLGHMLENPANFGIHNGEIKFRDGGSTGLERILTETEEEPNVKNALGALMLKHST